jgi:hypothetical protein
MNYYNYSVFRITSTGGYRFKGRVSVSIGKNNANRAFEKARQELNLHAGHYVLICTDESWFKKDGIWGGFYTLKPVSTPLVVERGVSSIDVDG